MSRPFRGAAPSAREFVLAHTRAGRVLRIAFIAALALGIGGSAARRSIAATAPERVRVTSIDGAPHIGANDLARLLDATKFWRSDVRKLVLRRGEHRVQLTVDNPFVLVDNHTVWLGRPVRSVHGELQIPVALLDSLPRDSSISRLIYDARLDAVVALPAGGVVRTPQVVVSQAATRFTFPIERISDASIGGRARNRFRLQLSGYFTGTLPDSTAALGDVRSVRAMSSAGGSTFEFDVAPDAAGWKLTRDEHRATLEFPRAAGSGVEEFAPESPAGPRGLRVIVLDPGHGGPDAGVRVGELSEKDITLRLARLLRTELERRLRARVLLTRDSDVELSGDRRAESANRARADLVIALHVDGYGTPGARGATAWYAPATFGAAGGAAPAGFQSTMDVVAWRDVATRWAVPSRALAEAVLSSIALRGQGPVRLRERLPYPLLGVNAPGLMLECGTLTGPDGANRLGAGESLQELAAAIADGIVAYQRND